MNRLLKHLSPRQQAWVLDHGILLIAVPVALLLMALFFAFWRFEPHQHAGFVPVEVLTTHDLTDEMNYRVRGIVRLPDGAEVVVSANSFGKAQWLAQDTCVEVRQTTQTGRKLYRLAAPANCRD